MEIVGTNQNSPFIAPIDTDAAYPARVGEPSVDGPVIYPSPEPDMPDNVVPFQRETGVNPKSIPSLKSLVGTPKGRSSGLGQAATSMRVTTMQRLGEAPTEAAVAPTPEQAITAATGLPAGQTAPSEKKPFSMPWWGVALVAAGAAAVAYSMSKGKNNEPLVADMEDEEEEDEG